MGFAMEQSAVTSTAELEIRGLIERLVTAWDAGDGEGYGRAFTEDCDYVTFNGERTRGRAAVAAGHQALFDTHLQGSRLVFESVTLRPLDAAAVLVHGVGATLLKGQKTPQKSRRSIQTLVATQTPDGWRFAAFQNTRIFEITPFRAALMMLGL